MGISWSDVIMFIGITVICGSPLWAACWIFYQLMTDNWGKPCPGCGRPIMTGGCPCGKGPERG